MNAHKRYKLMKLEAIVKKMQADKAANETVEEKPVVKEEVVVEPVVQVAEPEPVKVEEPVVVAAPVSKKKKSTS